MIHPDDFLRRSSMRWAMESPSHGVQSSSDCLNDIHKPSSNVSMKRPIRRRWSTTMRTFWNVLLPKNEWQVPIWIDWQTWGVSFGAHDLAYLIGLHWFPERRRRFEKNILRTYLAELHRRGIDYRYDDLTYDYRLQVAGQLFTPMYFWALKVPASTWWPHLDRAFSAFDDLDCHELFRV